MPRSWVTVIQSHSITNYRTGKSFTTNGDRGEKMSQVLTMVIAIFDNVVHTTVKGKAKVYDDAKNFDRVWHHDVPIGHSKKMYLVISSTYVIGSSFYKEKHRYVTVR